MAAKKVLIVDDNNDLAALMAMRLEAAGYDVNSADSGESCLEKVSAFSPDFILLDVDMPRKNGLATFLELKRQLIPAKSETGKSVFPVLVSTGMKNPALKELFENEGVFDYLTKPVRAEDLLESLSRACSVFA